MKFGKPNGHKQLPETLVLLFLLAQTSLLPQLSSADFTANNERFLKLQSQTAYSTVHASASGTNAFITFLDKPWILDSGASYHMTGTKENFHSVFLT